MNAIAKGLRQLKDAQTAYDLRQWVNAASLARSAKTNLDDVFAPVVQRDKANELLRQAQRRLNHPNAGWLRRAWWAIDGPWLTALSHSELGYGRVHWEK